MPIVLFANLKGGVAKTTSAVAVAECLAASGKPTLLIDADHQCTSSELLLGESRLENLERKRQTFHDLLGKMLRPDFDETQFDRYVADKASNIAGGLDHLSVLPCSIRINDFETNYAKSGMGFKTWKEFRSLFDVNRMKFKRWLEANFAYTIVDCPPSLAIQVKQLVGVSDTYVIPCQPNRLSIRGAEWLSQRIKKAGYRRDCLGTLWSMCRGNDRAHRRIIAMAAAGDSAFRHLPRPFETTIPLAANIAHAVEECETSPKSLRAKYGPEFGRIFVTLTNEFISRLESAGYETPSKRSDTRELVAVS